MQDMIVYVVYVPEARGKGQRLASLRSSIMKPYGVAFSLSGPPNGTSWCTSLGRGLYLSITDDEEGGEEAKGGDRDSAFKATQQERFSEGLLFGSCVLCYILLLVAYRVMS